MLMQAHAYNVIPRCDASDMGAGLTILRASPAVHAGRISNRSDATVYRLVG